MDITDIKTQRSKLDANGFVEVLRQYRHGANIREIASGMLLSHHQIYDYLNEHKDAWRAMRAADAVHAQSLMDQVMSIATDDLDPRRAKNRMHACLSLAKCYDRERFGDKTITEVNHKVDIGYLMAQAAQRLKDVSPQILVIQQQSPDITSDTISDVEDDYINGTGLFS